MDNPHTSWATPQARAVFPAVQVLALVAVAIGVAVDAMAMLPGAAWLESCANPELLLLRSWYYIDMKYTYIYI